MMKRDNKNISDNLHKSTIKFRKTGFFSSSRLVIEEALMKCLYGLMVNM